MGIPVFQKSCPIFHSEGEREGKDYLPHLKIE